VYLWCCIVLRVLLFYYDAFFAFVFIVGEWDAWLKSKQIKIMIIVVSNSYIIWSFKKKSIDGCSCHWFSIIIFLLVFYGEKSNEWRKREIIRICFSWSSRQRLCIIYIISSLISIEIRQQYNNINSIFFLMFQLISTSTHEHYLYYFQFK
jgi:hypothetical protein